MDQTRLPTTNGHNSYMTWEFLSFCLENNIIPLCLADHLTDILQPLDVGVFRPPSRNYSQILKEWLEAINGGIRKGTCYQYRSSLLQQQEAD